MKTTRNTNAKRLIQELIISSPNALSHNEIQNNLHEVCDRVTIYRVLERLMNERVIHKIINIDGVAKYAGCHSCSQSQTHNHNHIHFSCKNCKIVTCLDEVEVSFKLPKEYKINEVNFTVSGICKNCEGN